VTITAIGVYDFRPETEHEGQRLLNEYVRFVRSRSRPRTVFVGAALDTPRRYIVVATYGDPRDAKDTEDAFWRQAAAGGTVGRLARLCASPPVVNRLLHE
jgi:hypothetical protein